MHFRPGSIDRRDAHTRRPSNSWYCARQLVLSTPTHPAAHDLPSLQQTLPSTMQLLPQQSYLVVSTCLSGASPHRTTYPGLQDLPPPQHLPPCIAQPPPLQQPYPGLQYVPSLQHLPPGGAHVPVLRQHPQLHVSVDLRGLRSRKRRGSSGELSYPAATNLATAATHPDGQW
jgi:hypothetical protein